VCSPRSPRASRSCAGSPGGDEQIEDYQLDFAVGGRELARGIAPNDQPYVYDAQYQDIVPNERIVSIWSAREPSRAGSSDCTTSLGEPRARERFASCDSPGSD
jgi:uncharacterized protein YndB with AHSA1/START domain